MTQQLLQETFTSDESRIILESGENNNLWLQGIFMQANVKNRNGRNYPINEISQACDTATRMIAENNGIFGELDHPQTLNINLDRISHVIENLNMNGNNAIGKARLLETPCGKIAKELINSGVRMGVSSRGAGNVNESGEVSGFNFITVDLVCTPSAQGATPAAVYESLDLGGKNKKIMTLAENLQHDPAAQKYFKAAIMKFLKEDLLAKR